MNNTFTTNLHALASLTQAFCKMTGIETEEFIDATNRAIVSNIHGYYEQKGQTFNIFTMPIEKEAIDYCIDHLAQVATMATLAAAMGITPEMIKDI